MLSKLEPESACSAFNLNLDSELASLHLGYSDINLNVSVYLPDLERIHICEVQINHQLMLEAKKEAHLYYEEVRSLMPLICGADSEDVQAYLMECLNSSQVDAAVEVLMVRLAQVEHIRLTLG